MLLIGCAGRTASDSETVAWYCLGFCSGVAHEQSVLTAKNKNGILSSAITKNSILKSATNESIKQK